MHEIHLTVRFGETDLLGHVNNANYFSYLEHGRVKFFEHVSSEEAGFVYDRFQFTLASIKCDFIQQTYFNQELTVGTMISHIGNKSFKLEQPIYNRETGELVAVGESVIVCFDFDAQKSRAIPEPLQKILQENYGTLER